MTDTPVQHLADLARLRGAPELAPQIRNELRGELDQAMAQVFDLSHAGVDVVVVDTLCDADGQRFHVSSSHAAIGVQALVDHHQGAGLLIELRIVHGQKSADVDHSVFLGRHGGGIGQAAYLVHDLADAAVLLARLPLLNEIGVLRNPSHIMDQHDVLPIAPFPQLTEVFQ